MLDSTDMEQAISRRNLLKSLPAAALATRALGQAKPTIPISGYSHMTLSVTDPQRSQEFYQGLFGMPVQARQGALPSLRIGSGPQFLFLSKAAAGAKPGFNHWCVATKNFDVDRILGILAQHGIEKGDTREPLKTRVRMRGPENGGAKDGTPELYVSDPDGLLMQIQDVSYCGGAGKLGEVCMAKPEPSPKKGLLAMEDISHFTLFVSESKRSFDFYQSVFGMPVSGHQGPTPLLGVGAGGPFLTIAGGGGGRGGAAPAAAINHASFRMRNFDTAKVMQALESYGIKPRPSDARGPAGPLQSYITMRMPNRGGAPDGTPELYFTDPDGILLQIQDMSYCGGGGKMGEVCVP